jgi:LEA14-like dessication related protein
METNLHFRSALTAFVAVTIALLQGCDVVQQAQQAVNLTNCQFRIRSVENVTAAGVNVQNYKSIKDVSMTDAAKIMAAAAKTTFPLSMQLSMEGKNPNTASAGLNRFDYILFIDDIQMTAGSLEQSFVIPPNNGIAVIPLQISIDLKKVLSGKSLDAIMNFGFNLAGVGNKPTRITIKLKPTIMIGPTMLDYPGYITVGTEFGS